MTKAKEAPIVFQDGFLELLRETSAPVAIYLLNGIKLQGHITHFDSHVIILRAAAISQMVYKHAVLTIVPAVAF